MLSLEAQDYSQARFSGFKLISTDYATFYHDFFFVQEPLLMSVAAVNQRKLLLNQYAEV